MTREGVSNIGYNPTDNSLINFRGSRPEDEQSEGLWRVKTAVLTPGDSVDYKIKADKGETLLAGVTSDAFDPALSVISPKGTQVFKNDDREEGDQSPFVAYRFPEAGTYTLKVLSYRAVSGGKFTLHLRTFMAIDAPMGVATLPSSPLANGQMANRIAFRIVAKKGEIFDLRRVTEQSGQRHSPIQIVRIIGPTGVQQNDLAWIPDQSGTPVFQAMTDGDFYAEYWSNQGHDFTTDFAKVKTLPVKVEDEARFELGPKELEIVEFPAAVDEIVRTTISAPSANQLLSASAESSAPGEFGEYSDSGTNKGWTWFRLNVDSDADIVRIFHVNATVRVAIRSTAGHVQQVLIKNTRSVPLWSDGKALDSFLGIGEARLFIIKSTKSELMHVFAGASHFLPRLDIYRLNGELANSLLDRKTHTAADDLYFPDAGTFVVRLTCEGNGGSGDFQMKRESISALPYALGAPTEMKLDGNNFGLYSVSLQAGKRYELITDQPGKPLRADLLDQDGQFLVSRGIVFDKVEVQYFVPARSGPHRLWLRGDSGLRHFKFQPNVPPSIGP